MQFDCNFLHDLSAIVVFFSELGECCVFNIETSGDRQMKM